MKVAITLLVVVKATHEVDDMKYGFLSLITPNVKAKKVKWQIESINKAPHNLFKRRKVDCLIQSDTWK